MVAGLYFDPWHGGCLRRVVKTGRDTYAIHGVYGRDDKDTIPRGVEYDPEAPILTHRYWRADLRLCETQGHRHVLIVDFSRKAGKKRVVYRAVYDEQKRVIEWDDTNEWKQLYFSPMQLTGLCRAARPSA